MIKHILFGVGGAVLVWAVILATFFGMLGMPFWRFL